MKKLVVMLLVVGLIAACSQTPRQNTKIDKNVSDFETWVMDRHIEKTGVSGVAFCEGKGIFRYFESQNYYLITCKDGSGYTLRKS